MVIISDKKAVNILYGYGTQSAKQ